MNFSKFAVPALHLVARDTPGGFSRLGGLPDLPAGVDWPSWKGEPLAFLAQIAIAELPADNFVRAAVKEGYLYFFYDQEQSTWGFDPADIGSWRVIHSTSSPEPERDALGLDDDFIYAEKPVQFKPIASLPDSQRLEDQLASEGADDDDEDEDLEDLHDALYDEKVAAYDGPMHQMGGFPYVVQNDTMELECQLASNGLYCGDSSGYEDPRAASLEKGAPEWRLLLQLDSDDDANMMWGDCGLLYFWIRESDLVRRDFDKCWMILQCS